MAAGLYLWWPARDDPASRTAVGAALLTGAVVAFAIFLLQVVMDARFDELEERRANERALQDLRVQVHTSETLEGFDFHVGRVRDLSGFYFVNKTLSDTDFRGLPLYGAKFTGADLRRAKLDDAKLNDADFIAANMEGAFLIRAELIRADMTLACLRLANLMGADLSGADLTDADLSDATYNRATVWPSGRRRKCGRRECQYPERREPADSCV